VHHRRSFSPVAVAYGDVAIKADEIPPAVLPL